jgi:SAM-dependent methyltransferase
MPFREAVKRVASPAALKRVQRWEERLASSSIRAALREQGLTQLVGTLPRIVPDITQQYTSFRVESEYDRLKVRGMHAFQVSLAGRAIERVQHDTTPISVVDIGDSAGTHLEYLREIYRHLPLKVLGINLDEQAVKRIRERALPAMQVRAEDLVSHGITADIFLLFETLEHLMSPIQFLRDLSRRTACRALVVTVPYLARSRVGLHHIRARRQEACGPETVHIFELSPGDWSLLFRHAGWSIVEDRLYLQYPRRGPLRALKPYWRWRDFEGFWGAVLERDHTWTDLYDGWEVDR